MKTVISLVCESACSLYESQFYYFLFFQFEEAVHYDTLMGFGYVTKSIDLDFTSSETNEAMFHISVSQEFAPHNVGADILFHKVFE